MHRADVRERDRQDRGGAVTENGAIYIPALSLQCRAHADHLGHGSLLMGRPKKPFGIRMPLSPVTVTFKKRISNLVCFWAYPPSADIIHICTPPSSIRSLGRRSLKHHRKRLRSTLGSPSQQRRRRRTPFFAQGERNFGEMPEISGYFGAEVARELLRRR